MMLVKRYPDYRGFYGGDVLVGWCILCDELVLSNLAGS